MTKILFNEESHTYHVDGVLTPSVTTILAATKFKDKYKGIPKGVLANAATFGTNVHRAIEFDDPEGLGLREMLAYEQWLKVQKKHGIVPVAKEQKVHYGTLFVGTFDMIAIIEGEKWLLDIKTTAQLDKEYIGYQESFYETAYLDMYPDEDEFDRFGVIWLPKGKIGKLIEIEPVDNEELQKILDEYRELSDEVEESQFEFSAN